ncbi:hypothetical protein LEP1GSC173_1989 [Leptospira interrogans str. HAI1594]|nr:hypothetical protein LEP1GSC117_2323 [Leptospira interrogans serovar Icterohaemorrhagiae str. Verdun LP]EKP74694.1 hypothetical protein LEP1GSC173_1989 [Leptospira interrogans str. HAI1594]EMN49475.1 hypothetical protein LEP1GSC088_1989 [Leptospira interrogans str. L1207]EMN65243.1 hypothetical protein LEP1GSC098_4582 [Leptospira interrogans serovar Grippotyphosa str. UI 08434]EMO17381.1 hypothetical protein LEP1GSC167_0242 [Leptospira interrogans serovar Copenhageni str. HAI0188]EMO38190.1
MNNKILFQKKKKQIEIDTIELLRNSLSTIADLYKMEYR